VTETLRAALLDRYDPRQGDGGEHDPGSIPPVLHGHGFEGTGYATACYLALPDVGFPRSRGRIHGAAVLLPAGVPAAVVDGVRAAVASLDVLEQPGVFRTRVSIYGDEPSPRAATPLRWRGSPSRMWASAFPVLHERFRRGGPTLDDVVRWCVHAGMPEPVSFEVSRVPFVSGAVSLMPHEVYRDQRERTPYSHLAVSFADPVTGPFALGRGRQFGLGLMCPLRLGL
jgi:CRISPR-associated protein Csb2